MEQELNLAPLHELFTISISPEELAMQLDDLAYDYACTVIQLQLRSKENEDFLHEQIPGYILRLKELRNALRECC